METVILNPEQELERDLQWHTTSRMVSAPEPMQIGPTVTDRPGIEMPENMGTIHSN